MTRIVRYYPRALSGDGGMTTAVHEWSKALRRLGVDAAIAYNADDATRPPPRDGLDWVPVHHAGRHALAVPTDLGAHLSGADLLVLHSGWTRYNLLAAREARRRGVPYLLEPRGAYDPHIVGRKRLLKRAWWVMRERRMVDGAAAIHLFFPEEEAHLRELGYGGPLVVAPNGIRNPYGATWDQGSGGFVLWFGRFDPEHKGLDLLLRALELLPPDLRPRVRLHGPDWRGRKARVAALVRRLGLDDTVVLGAPVHDGAKFALLSEARAFVYPSRWEAFGNSVAEAAAVGLPIVTTRYPLGNYLAAHAAGVACEATPADLAYGLSRALQPDAVRLGAAARRLATVDLPWDHVADRWLAQVGEVL